MKTVIAVCLTALITTAGASAVTSALIGSAQIANGSIRPIDLHPATKALLRAGKQGERGPQGAQGIAGPTGPQGPGRTGRDTGAPGLQRSRRLFRRLRPEQSQLRHRPDRVRSGRTSRRSLRLLPCRHEGHRRRLLHQHYRRRWHR